MCVDGPCTGGDNSPADWILTLSHGLEVQFAAVASKPGHGAGPDLEHIDASRLEATDDHCVGRAFDDRRVQIRLVLREEKQHGKQQR